MGFSLASGYVGENSGSGFDERRFGISKPVYRIIRAQLIATVLAFATCSYFDWVAAYSILLGGTVCVVPAGFAAWRLSRRTPVAGVAALHMIMAETGKLLLTMALFVAVFVLVKPLNVLFFFGSLVGLHGFFIFVPMMDRLRMK